MRRYALCLTCVIAAGLLLGLLGCGSNDTFSPSVSGNNNPSFTLSANPTSRTVAQGGSASYTITVTSVGGFSNSVALSASNLPTGTTASFNPTSVTPTGNSTLTLTTTGPTSGSLTGTIKSEPRNRSQLDNPTPLGSYTITVTGASGSITKQITVDLTVNSGE